MTGAHRPTVTVLRAHGKLMAKRFSGANYEVRQYDDAYQYHYVDLDELNLAPTNIEDLSAVLGALESDPHAVLIRGVLAEGINPNRPVLRRIKAKGGHPSYFVERQDGVPWAMIDFDKLTPPPDKVTDQQRLDWLVSLLPGEFQDCSFHYQMSSSARLPGKTTISAHCFFWLATPRTDSEMHRWAEWINRQHLLRPDVIAGDVTKPKLVDPAVFVTNQPNYVAAPVFDDGAADPYREGGRSGLVQRACDTVEVVIPPERETTRLDAIERELQRKHFATHRLGLADSVGDTYADKLAAIGAPNFNKAIMAAISTAVLMRGRDLVADTVKQEIRACIDANYVELRRSEMERYKSDDYLDEAIDSAIGLFGRTDIERLRERLTYQGRRQEEARHRDAVLPFVDDESKIIPFNFLDDPCGSGKSFQFRDLIISGDEHHWLYAVDKIERIAEVVAELQGHHWRAGGIEVHDAFTGKEDDDGNVENVVGQLAGIRNRIDSRKMANGNYHSVTFITHAALLMYPWRERGWDDHSLICDEKPGIWFCDVMDDVHRNFAILERYFVIEKREGDRILLALTDDGRRVGEGTRPDVFDRRIWPLLNLACRGRRVWVNRSGWDSRGNEQIDFYALTMPEAFAGFRSRWVAADNLSQSLLYRLWERRGVAWTKVNLPGGRQRTTPLSQRGAVFYFMRHGASFTRFKQPDQPLLCAARYISALHDRVLYSVNNRRFASKVHDVFDGDGHLAVTPKQTGTERYKSFNVAFWGAAIQASQTESDLIFRETGGMTRRELDLDREFDALNQFAFRTEARDYNSDEPFLLYVMSQAQAEYFADRYGLGIAHVPGVIVEHEQDKGGRPKTVGIKAMSPEEKRAYKTQKQRESRAKAKPQM